MIEIVLLVLFLPLSALMMFAAWCGLAPMPEVPEMSKMPKMDDEQ